jgi:hypothetical protein
MGPKQRSRANIKVYGWPEGFTEAQVVELFDELESRGIELDASYEDAMAMLVEARNAKPWQDNVERDQGIVDAGAPQPWNAVDRDRGLQPEPQEAPVTIGGGAATVSEEGAIPNMQQQILQNRERGVGNTDPEGLIGAATRGLAPASAKAGFGAVVGTALAPVPGMNPATGALLMEVVPGADTAAIQGLNKLNQLYNRINGFEPGSEQALPEYSGTEDFMDQMGVAASDSPLERGVQAGTRMGATTATMSGLAQAAAPLTSLTPTTQITADGVAQLTQAPGWKQFVEQLRSGIAANPMNQFLGGTAGETAGTVAQENVEAEGGTEFQQQVARDLTSFVADAGVTTIADFFTGLRNIISRRAANTPAPRGQRSPYSRSELNIPDNPELRAGVAPEGVRAENPTPEGTNLQNISESMMGGTQAYRYQRYNENAREVLDFMESEGVYVDALGNYPRLAEELMEDFKTTRGGILTENVDAKREVIDRLSQNNEVVPVNQGMETLTRLRNEELALQGVDDSASAVLTPELRFWNDLYERIQNKNFDQLETIRRRFQERIKNENMPSDMQQKLREVYHSVFGGYDGDGVRIEGDIDNYIRASGTQEDLNQYLTANRTLHNLAEEFDDVALKEVLSEWQKSSATMRPEAITDMLFSRDRSAVEKLYNQLSDEGKATARQAVVSEFARANAQENMTAFSPSVFAANIRDFGDQVGIFFDDRELQYLQGLYQHLNLTRRSEEFVRRAAGFQGLPTSQIPGGGTLLSMGVRGNPGIGIGLSIGSLGGLSKLARIYEQSPAIRDMVMELATLQPNSQNASNLSALIERAVLREIEDYEEPEQQPSNVERARALVERRQ